MTKPLVSIALATYNGEKFLKQQMDSLLAQDYPNLEIVISDDCSTDGTWEILQNYALKDNRIKLLPREEKNIGYINNFIKVFMACRGEFISPCDQDDIWHVDKTSRLVSEIDNAMLVYCDNRFIDEEDNPIGINYSDTVRFMISGNDCRNFLFYNSILGHTMLFRRDLLGIISDMTSIGYIDWLIAFYAAEYGGIVYLKETLVDWRQHSESTTFNVRNGGEKAKAVMVDENALNVFSSVESTHQEFACRAFKTWLKWKNSYLNFSMFIFIIRYGSITHCHHPAKFPALKYLLGYKLKKLIRPNFY
ncbi:glycosyltransferase family 2 protein [Acinetobacter wuhouensis]|uniref:glycosyltransferase family 2 protein n=1 Tax=Acinetobacter wuhouensis TaxID=1879050 RepID=UPI00083B7716|nr:glycosyltransferase family 2 protein [Acinetobacter wuhouensis]AXQ20983.1 glycosyltransferase family 2 protein [Acinetobacter wuhouensis]